MHMDDFTFQEPIWLIFGISTQLSCIFIYFFFAKDVLGLFSSAYKIIIHLTDRALVNIKVCDSNTEFNYKIKFTTMEHQQYTVNLGLLGAPGGLGLQGSHLPPCYCPLSLVLNRLQLSKMAAKHSSK